MAPVSATTHEPMGKRSWFLIVYLLIVTVLTFYVVYSLWSAQPRVAEGRVPATNCVPGASPVLSNLYPEWVNVGSTASDVLILGCGFTTATQIKFNGTLHSALLVDASHIRVGLAGADVAAAGNVVVTLSNGAADFGSAVLSMVPASVCWKFLGAGPCPISQEVQLLLMVLFTGALGSCVYALKSMADYEGDGKLYVTWFKYYLIQPFEGAGIAFLLYLVVRGGFLAGANADVKTVNQFGMCAIAGLAGAFSDTAFLKLREVFQSLFKPQDDRGGKLTAKVTTASLPDGAVGMPYKQTLQASGVTAPLKWSVTPGLPDGLSLDDTAGIISGTPTAVSAKTSYKFTVTDSATPAASSTADLTLEIKPGASGPKIATTALLDGVVGAPYKQAVQASGGTAALKWSVTPDLPAGLSLDATTGIVSGTPTAVSPKLSYIFTVTDSATPAASSTADLSFEITAASPQ